MMWSERKNRKYFEALKKNQLLKNLSEKILAQLLQELEEVIWPSTTCSINSNRTSYHFHFIISGRLKVYQIDSNSGREFTYFLLGETDAFDIICLLDGCEHIIYYETLDRVVLLSLPMENMKIWLKKHPVLIQNLLPYLSHQMRILEEYAASVTLIDISTRLARLFLNNLNCETGELELINNLSNEELANLIGSTRAVVNRHLQQFKKEGIVKLGRKRIQVKNIDLLLEKANNSGASAP